MSATIKKSLLMCHNICILMIKFNITVVCSARKYLSYKRDQENIYQKENYSYMAKIISRSAEHVSEVLLTTPSVIPSDIYTNPIISEHREPKPWCKIKSCWSKHHKNNLEWQKRTMQKNSLEQVGTSFDAVISFKQYIDERCIFLVSKQYVLRFQKPNWSWLLKVSHLKVSCLKNFGLLMEKLVELKILKHWLLLYITHYWNVKYHSPLCSASIKIRYVLSCFGTYSIRFIRKQLTQIKSLIHSVSQQMWI